MRRGVDMYYYFTFSMCMTQSIHQCFFFFWCLIHFQYVHESAMNNEVFLLIIVNSLSVCA